MNTGVYVIEHISSGKKYVGSAGRSFKSRWGQHRSGLRKGTHNSRYLQNAWNKYGEESFLFRIVKCTSPEEAVSYEQAFIDLYKSADRKFGYNISPIAGSSLGVKRTAETRAKISAANIGKKRGPHSPNAIAKMTGQKRSDETRARISSAASSWQKGRKLSPETRAKMSAWQKGRKLTTEHCENMSAAKRGHKDNVGVKHTAEARKNMSVAQKKRFAKQHGHETGFVTIEGGPTV